MFFLNDSDIIPGVSIGTLRLGMTLSEVKSILINYSVVDLLTYLKISCENVVVTLEKESNSVTQILVRGSFKGKYAGKIGLGNTLTDVKNLLGLGWHERLDVFILDGVPGMGFELGDTDDPVEWDELTPPIEYICVFPADECTELGK